MLNDTIPSQLLYLKYIQREIDNVVISPINREFLLKKIKTFREKADATPQFYLLNEREGTLSEQLMDAYIGFAAKFSSELTLLVSQAIGSLKLITSNVPLQPYGNILPKDALPANDKRIPVQVDRRLSLKNDFLKLADHGIISKEDVLYWLSADFQGFNPAYMERVITPAANTEQGLIIFFIRKIYLKYEENKNRMSLYRKMLQRRISLCEDLKDDYLLSHFSDDQPAKFPDSLIP
jgi:hypothetical protein